MLRATIGLMFGKRKNKPVEGGAPEDFVRASLEGLRMQTNAHAQTWGLGSGKGWDVDLTVGKITFTFDDKVVEAPIEVVGTYDSKKGTFMWGWDHPSVPTQLRGAALAAKKWGQENNQAKYLERVTKCTEEEAWNFTAVAARLSEANGAYRGVSGTTFVYMTFGKTTMKRL